MGFGAVAPERISSIIASTCPFTKRSSSASWAGEARSPISFGLLGTYHNTGYKNGRWRDVVWFEKHIGSFDGVPEPIRPIGQLADREAVLRTI